MLGRALAGVLIIMAGGFTAAAAGGTAAAAAPAQACAVSTVIEITSFAFSPPAVTPGNSSTATLTALNCTDQTQQTSETWSGRFTGPSSSGIPAGCPAIDPIAFGVTFPPDGTASRSVGYLVPASCTASELVVTADIHGTNGNLLAAGTATLQIVHDTPPQS
jgi:hypothetical protein